MAEHEQFLLVEKMFNRERKAIKFIENYYADYLKKPNLKIELSTNPHDTTSYCDLENNLIVISANNLRHLMLQDNRLSFKMFYTLLLHEIGHAIYTSIYMGYSQTINILEDNRLEFNISLWNKAVRFDVIRYALFDKQYEQDLSIFKRAKSNPMLVGLMLLRTIDNAPYVKHFSQKPETEQIVKRILYLDNAYTMKADRADMSKSKAKEFVSIAEEVEQLLQKLCEEQLPPPPPPTKQGKGGNKGGKPTKEKPQSSNTINNDNEQDPKANEKQELERNLEDAIRDNTTLKNEVDNGLGLLLNTNPKLDDYKPIDISAFQVARSIGIRGSGNEQRNSGNASQLSLKRYMRKGFDRNLKPFDKQVDKYSIGGKTESVAFYLDISGSMDGDKIINATRYLKTFYDLMSKHMYIRFFGFGRNSYELTRNELEIDFLTQKLEGATRINFVREIKQHEHVIVLTDGAIGGYIPQQYREKATFICLGYDIQEAVKHKKYLEEEKGVLSRNIIAVGNDNIIEGLDRATAFIKNVLR